MFAGSLKPVKGPASRPAMRVCYLCGQKFGSASIGIHIPQCYQKKLSQWEHNDPAIRGPRPKNPNTVNWKGGAGATVEQVNDAQYETFNSQLVPCPNCGRTFLPDRLPIHKRGCKGTGGLNRSPTSANTSTSKPTSSVRKQSTSQGRRSLSNGPPLLPTCYLCGQQFGTASIGIHVPQCYEKKMAQWRNADPNMRGPSPKHPDTVSWRGRPDATPAEQAEEQFQEFMSNLSPCPHCGRKFLPDRLTVHLRSCKPGSAAKRPPTRGESTRGKEAQSESSPPRLSADAASPTEERLDPKRKRLPRNSTVLVDGRACPQCAVVEYDVDAKFCRECGFSLDSSRRPELCRHCGECMPFGSRFCGTCGQPVDGAAANERTPGGDAQTLSSTRVVVCPACHVRCDADGNFCDNCGAALGEADVASPSSNSVATSTHSSVSSKMEKGKEKTVSAAAGRPGPGAKYCPSCRTTVHDSGAVFCEDCGSRLEDNAVDMDGPPNSTYNTLPPDVVEKRKASKSVSFAAEPPASRAPAPLPSLRPAMDLEEAPGDDGVRQPCSHCGRQFAPAALARHENVCANQKHRRVFNAAKQRQADDAPTVSAHPLPKKAAAPVAVPKHDWKAESEAFRRALREARQVDQVLKSGGTTKDLPPPTYSSNPDYIPCPHCKRRFAPTVAQRHIPHCAMTINRPKPPPKRR